MEKHRVDMDILRTEMVRAHGACGGMIATSAHCCAQQETAEAARVQQVREANSRRLADLEEKQAQESNRLKEEIDVLKQQARKADDEIATLRKQLQVCVCPNCLRLFVHIRVQGRRRGPGALCCLCVCAAYRRRSSSTKARCTPWKQR